MKFQHSAFIRRNTPELRKKLEELAYEKSELYREKDDVLISDSKGIYGSSEPSCMYADLCETDIDCGTNESLFLAIAAIREDSDKDQWFVADANIMYHLAFPDGEPFFGEIEKGELFCMDKAMMHADIMGEERFIQDLSHKASPKELEEHFKEREV